MIKFNCPACGKKIAVQDEHAGKKARCPGCKQVFTIPLASTRPEAVTEPTPNSRTPEPQTLSLSAQSENRTVEHSDEGQVPPTAAATITDDSTEFSNRHNKTVTTVLLIYAITSVGVIGLVLGILALAGVFTGNPEEMRDATKNQASAESSSAESASSTLVQPGTDSVSLSLSWLEKMEKMSPEELKAAEQEAITLYQKSFSKYKIKLENMAWLHKRRAAALGTQCDYDIVNGYYNAYLGFFSPFSQRADCSLKDLFNKLSDNHAARQSGNAEGEMSQEWTEFFSLETLRVGAREFEKVCTEAYDLLRYDIPSHSPLSILATGVANVWGKLSSDEERQEILERVDSVVEKGNFREQDEKTFKKFMEELKQQFSVPNEDDDFN